MKNKILAALIFSVCAVCFHTQNLEAGSNKTTGEKVDDAIDSAKDKLQEGQDKAKDAYDNAKEKAAEGYDKAKEKTRDGLDKIKPN